MAPGGRQGGYEYVYMVYLTNRNHPQISTSLHVYTELCIVQLSIFEVFIHGTRRTLHRARFCCYFLPLNLAKVTFQFSDTPSCLSFFRTWLYIELDG